MSTIYWRDSSLYLDGRELARIEPGRPVAGIPAGLTMTKPNREQIRERAENVFRTVTPLERDDAMAAYKAQRQNERERMLQIRRLRLERDEGR